MKSQLRFTNTFSSELPGDSGPPHVSRPTPGAMYSLVPATPVRAPELLIWSDDAARLLNIDRHQEDDEELARIFSGNKKLSGMQTIATRYGGHQFGTWADQLGDGRALLLGEIKNSRGENWEIQLKGAGPTPYSRRADGRAVLRSSLREFLCSEALYHLGVPTTRALCCVTTGEKVVRDMFYDGHPQEEPGAITTRLAPSFLRFGHFEILAAHDESELLRRLVEYSIKHDFSQLDPKSEDRFIKWYEEICVRTAKLMIEWSRVGFVHGVMNTDNLSILGLTIDFGPYGFIDSYDPDWTPNTTDAQTRRYRFGAQPSVAFWNLARLAEALLTLNIDQATLEGCLEKYKETYEREFLKMMANKLGLVKLADEEGLVLLRDLEAALRSTEIDMTIFYGQLGAVHDLNKTEKENESRLLDVFRDAFYQQPSAAEARPFLDWMKKYFAAVDIDALSAVERKHRMINANPRFILRNYLVQEALDALANDDRSVLDALMAALKNPYADNGTTAPFYKRRPEWARVKAGCSALSCSS